MKTSKTASAAAGYDYIVVGSGSAGSAVAGRLSDDSEVRVLLLEQGPANTGWTVRMPGATRENYRPGSRYMRRYPTVPQKHLNGRIIDHPRGYGLGGSSLVNGMVYLRGSPYDYDRWEAEGAAGWSYASVLPYFKRMERRAEGATEYRGAHGPVGVRRKSDLDPLSEAFLLAGRQASYPFTDDVNGFRQEGFCLFDMNVDRGYRSSSSYAYIERRGPKRNLSVQTGALTRRILLERGRAVGVEYMLGGKSIVARANREIVLSAGAIGSPQLLMLSGIGPADELRRLGIPLQHDLPGVGRNLQDHVELDLQWESTRAISFNRYLRPDRMALVGLQWFLFKSGFCATNQVYAGAFLRGSAEVAHPNIQFHFIPVSFDGWQAPRNRYGFRVSAGPMRQRSRGHLALVSDNPLDPPLLDPNYLSDEADLDELRDSYRMIQEVVSQPAFDDYRGRPIEPNVMPTGRRAIDEVIRNHSGSGFHLCGTCKMGPASDRWAVVDNETSVHGLEGLRVVDASIIPSIVSGNLNCPVMMMGEKASDMIAGKSPLPPEYHPYHRPSGPPREVEGAAATA